MTNDERSYQDLEAKLGLAADALLNIIGHNAHLPGLAELKTSLRKAVHRIQTARLLLAAKGRLNARGTAKKTHSALTGREFGGAPRRKAMLRCLGNNADHRAKVAKLPGRLLRYAVQQAGGNTESAVRWLQSRQPHPFADIPLHIRLDRLKKIAAGLTLTAARSAPPTGVNHT